MSIATIENSATVAVAGLSSALKAAALFTSKPRRGVDPSPYCRIRVASTPGAIGIESTDTETRFTASATVWGSPTFGVAVDPSAIKSRLSGDGFDVMHVDGGRFKARGLSVDAVDAVENWPELVKTPDAIGGRIVMDAETFFRIDREIVPATDADSSRYALGGVLFDADAVADGEYTAVANIVGTDGRRLHCLTLPAGSTPAEPALSRTSAIVHAGIVRRIAKAIRATIPRGVSKDCVAVSVEFDCHNELAAFYWQAGEFSYVVAVKQIAGRFPKWRDVFPDNPQLDNLHGDAGRGEYCETWRGRCGELVSTLKDALRGVCRETRDTAAAAVKFLGGENGECFLSASSPAGELSAAVAGYSTPGFSTRLRPNFVVDAAAGFGKDDDVRIFRKAGDTAAPVFLRRGRGLNSRHSVGFSAVIMPVTDN